MIPWNRCILKYEWSSLTRNQTNLDETDAEWLFFSKSFLYNGIY